MMYGVSSWRVHQPLVMETYMDVVVLTIGLWIETFLGTRVQEWQLQLQMLWRRH